MKILIHGSGHKAASWDKVISYMNNDKDILCPNLSTILNGREREIIFFISIQILF